MTLIHPFVIVKSMKDRHPPIYYKIRSFVRGAFWGGLALGAFLTIVHMTADKRPPCDITIVSPRHWVSDTPVDVSKCVAPDYMVLHQDGTWDWVG